jgi:hypothetical protein
VLLVVEGRGVTGAGGGRLCSVEAEGYVAGVHVVAQPLHAAGEARCVGVKRSRSITRGGGGHPAVVDVDAGAREGKAASLARRLQQRTKPVVSELQKAAVDERVSLLLVPARGQSVRGAASAGLEGGWRRTAAR